MSKEEMINLLMRDIESDRFRADSRAGADNPQVDQAMKAEWSRLNARSYSEIEALYFKSEELYAISA